MSPTHRQEIEAILAGARAEHAAVLAQVSPGMRSSLPVDATGITQAIGYLAGVAGISEELQTEQARGHRANPAVLHGRVFGRAPLTRETVYAAFAAGARVRAQALRQLAGVVGGTPLEEQILGLLDEHSSGLHSTGDASETELRAAYQAQEYAAVRIASHLDDVRGR